MTRFLLLALLVVPSPSPLPCYPTPLTPAQAAANIAAEHPPCRKNTGWTWVFQGDGCAPVDRVPYPPCAPAPSPQPSQPPGA